MTQNVVVHLPALRALAAGYRGHGTELSEHAAALAAIPLPAQSFGPAGEGFIEALASAVRHHACAARELGIRLHTAAGAANTTAAGYADTDARAGDRLDAWL
ncbi:type VII secretion target [Mycobacterium sp. OTB74]|jgi:hypothetical protein|uniref:type VII secretion target n=1 Tax=Mycobacterium sp. OTB74 TaxID=1853452 RepID=UPI002474A1F0|nr:type VII secretion target [Mycobacterium sp. OTB74]MDH6247639.1 hypothetical protein [Mycobacterium sp. OTB74]